MWGHRIIMTSSDYIAVLALIVSLFSFGTSLYFGLRDRVHLKVTSKILNHGGRFGHAHLEIKVVNRGRRPAILTMWGGELDTGKWVGTYVGEKGQGIRLEENEYYIEKLSVSDLEEFDDSEEEIHEYAKL